MNEQEITDWFVPKECINGLQQSTIEEMISRLKNSSMIDVIVRYEGQDYRYQADWIKYLRRGK